MFKVKLIWDFDKKSHKSTRRKKHHAASFGFGYSYNAGRSGKKSESHAQVNDTVNQVDRPAEKVKTENKAVSEACNSDWFNNLKRMYQEQKAHKDEIKSDNSKHHDSNQKYPELLDISAIRSKIGTLSPEDFIEHANKYLGWNIDPDHPYKLNKKRLTSEEVAKYKEFGEPDLTKNHLELFTPNVISDLFTILNYNSSNGTKGDVVREELGHLGFEFVGEGTNIIVLSHEWYPGVVFKIALDSNGIADNFNDEVLQYVIPRFTRVLARHSTGIVSVQERSIVMSSQRMKAYEHDILQLLKRLSSKYLIADLAPCRFLNFGVARDGGFIIQDGSDLFPIADMDHKIKCRNSIGWDEKKDKPIRCGGKLHYTTDYLSMVCETCGRIYNALELRPKTKEDEYEMAVCYKDGTTLAERKAMEEEEIAAIRRKFGVTDNSFINDDGTIVERRDLAELNGNDSDDDDGYMDIEDYERMNPGSTFETPQENEDDEDGEKEDVVDDDDDYSDEEEDESNNVIVQLPQVKQPVSDMDEVRRKLTNAKFSNFNKAAMNNSDEDEKSDDVTVLQDSLPNVEYKLIPVDPENGMDIDDDRVGIYLNIKGSFHEAWERSGLPIYISIDGGSTYSIAVQSQVIEKILKPVVEDLLEADE